MSASFWLLNQFEQIDSEIFLPSFLLFIKGKEGITFLKKKSRCSVFAGGESVLFLCVCVFSFERCADS